MKGVSGGLYGLGAFVVFNVVISDGNAKATGWTSVFDWLIY